MTTSSFPDISAKSTADQLLDSAQEFIQQRGYNGFSYEDMARAVGIKKPSIHYHFPTKEDLGVRVIERYTERFGAELESIARRLAEPNRRLDAYIELFVATYGSSRQLCPCGILAAEATAIPERVALAVQEFFRLNMSWLTRLLDDGRRKDQFTFFGDANDQALILLSALEGAMVVGKGLGNKASVSEIGKFLTRQLLG